MKLTFEVVDVGSPINNGLGVGLRQVTEYPGEALIANIDIPKTEATKRAYYVGRRVTVEIKPA